MLSWWKLLLLQLRQRQGVPTLVSTWRWLRTTRECVINRGVSVGAEAKKRQECQCKRFVRTSRGSRVIRDPTSECATRAEALDEQ
jgi:hypothetical protein